MEELVNKICMYGHLRIDGDNRRPWIVKVENWDKNSEDGWLMMNGPTKYKAGATLKEALEGLLKDLEK